jgi:hypothetical protein
MVRARLVIVVRANECEVDFAAEGCCFCVKMNVGEKKAASASADG